ncbi:MAG: hypothetical protein ACRD1Z_12285 [Vicinamibacteria bacterium]
MPPAPVEIAPASGDRHLLILLPTEARDEASIAELSRIASVSAYDARLSLSSPRPRLFRRLDTEGEARRFSEELSSARIPHYVVPEASATALPVARASVIDLRERHFEMVLDGASPSLAPAPYGELLLLVRGEITRERHDERRLGSAKGASRRLTSGLRLHLYLRDASVAVEIDPDLFDFRFLKDEKTVSALLNFEKLIARILEKAPGLGVDRGFDLEPLVLSRAGGSGDVTDALALSDHGPSGVPYDDEANFRFYARWRYRVARHLSRRDPA